MSNQKYQGLNKQEVLDTLSEKELWTSGEMRTMVSSMKGSIKSSATLEEVNIGDVFYQNGLRHPAVVVSKNEDGNYNCLLLTTKEEGLSVIEPCKSRFFHTSFITTTLTITDEETILNNFMGVYENKKQLKKVKKIFKELANNI